MRGDLVESGLSDYVFRRDQFLETIPEILRRYHVPRNVYSLLEVGVSVGGLELFAQFLPLIYKTYFPLMGGSFTGSARRAWMAPSRDLETN